MASTDDTPPGATALPVLGQPAHERADAARNRQTLLTTAQTIVTDCGVDALSMDKLAAAAGVGVGTVYRRFGDRGGLALALLDHVEQQFQAAFLSGPPPLGPGAPAAARIRAFLHAYIDRLDTDADLHAIAERGKSTSRYGSGAYRTARVHLVALLTETGSEVDVIYVAEALLALLDAGLFIHQRRELQFSIERIKVGADHVLASLIPGDL